MTATLTQDALGRLVLATESETFVDVSPVRCFPLTAPDGHIAFCDAKGHELWSIADPATLPEASRTLLAAELAKREFIPQIRRILDISSGAEPTHWQVETDRGATRFTLPSEDNVRRLGEGALVTDEHGLRYRVMDLRQLDKSSRRWMMRYL